MKQENISVLHVCLKLEVFKRKKKHFFSLLFEMMCIVPVYVCPRTNSIAQTLSTCHLLYLYVISSFLIELYRYTSIDILEAHQKKNTLLCVVGSVRENKCHRCSSHKHRFHKTRTIEIPTNIKLDGFLCCFFFLIYLCLLFIH